MEQLLESEERVTLICGGCGTRLPHPGSLDTAALVADVQACPPVCVVCACRPVFGPRPEAEVWEAIPGLGP